MITCRIRRRSASHVQVPLEKGLPPRTDLLLRGRARRRRLEYLPLQLSGRGMYNTAVCSVYVLLAVLWFNLFFFSTTMFARSLFFTRHMSTTYIYDGTMYVWHLLLFRKYCCFIMHQMWYFCFVLMITCDKTATAADWFLGHTYLVDNLRCNVCRLRLLWPPHVHPGGLLFLTTVHAMIHCCYLFDLVWFGLICTFCHVPRKPCSQLFGAFAACCFYTFSWREAWFFSAFLFGLLAVIQFWFTADRRLFGFFCIRTSFHGEVGKT